MLINTTTLSQSGPGSNVSERVTPHTPDVQNWDFTIRCSLVPYPEQPFFGVSLIPLQRIHSQCIQDEEVGYVDK